MVKYKLNFLLLSEVCIHLLFWLALFLLKAQNQVLVITTASDVLSLNENKLANYVGVLTFYWFYLLLIPRCIKRSLLVSLSVAILSLFVITALDSMLSNRDLIVQLDLMYWINFVGHCYFAISALIIQRSFAKIKRSWYDNAQQAQHTKTELALLKQQIHPHFLFNVLNSLFSSSYQYGDHKTSEGIGQLSDLLRYMLYETSADKVSLGNELNYLNDYIKLQMLRFSEDVQLEFVNSGHCSDTKIAPMLLITLVENAFKHGVIPEQKNSININLSCENNTIVFRVSNVVKANTAADKSVGGVGLINLERRLALLYDNKHQFTTAIKNNIFTAELILR